MEGMSSSASSGPSYEVFLSFRGADTRHGFTDYLYHAMVGVGILVFRDDESLRVGQKIGGEFLQAIENSKIYIPIFSKNYASSHWCLRELTYMVECTSKLNENKEILPIFLDVEPEDVKLKTDLYSQALAKHQEKFGAEVESWKKALNEVDEIKGWNLKKDQGLNAVAAMAAAAIGHHSGEKGMLSGGPYRWYRCNSSSQWHFCGGSAPFLS
ncbi:TMV resistance protein N-like isoform X2 [Eucalyptus grandis]|uniref:TMV resistance protein N-like isoform X2 n=1 Tax=Eucalyptus grandis TaxID=71139 RepID=UPI00192EFC35|nr:TMV resistance protein N-like isoform X2 [Eucalyptus grandis]